MIDHSEAGREKRPASDLSVVARGSFMRGAVRIVLAVAAMSQASCSGGGMLATGSLSDEMQKVTLFETANHRVAGRAKAEAASGEKTAAAVAAPRAPGAPARAYSGSPDGISLKDIYTNGGIVDVPRAQAYMHRVLDRLLQHWPYDLAHIGIFVVNMSFDAHSTAAGDILISAGMLEQLESEDELAAILGHEVSHIILSHHERAKQVADNKRLLNGAASAAVTYLMFSNTTWTKTGQGSYQGTVNTGNWLNQSLQAGGACLAATYLIDKFVDPGWSRSQEDEADLLGIDLMIKAGYNPNAALQAMRRRIEYEGEQKSQVQQRQQNGDYGKMVDDAVKKQGIAGIFTGAARGITSGLIDTFSDLDDYVTQRHRMSSDRLNGMQLYLDRHYPMRERKELQAASYVAVMKSTETAKTLEHHRLAVKARLAKSQDEAFALARRSIEPPTSGALAPRFTMYMLLSGMGKEEEAFQQLLQVKNLDSAPPQFFEALAHGYARRGRMDLAEEFKKRAVARTKSMFDEKDKSAGATFLARLINPQSGAGGDRFEVKGYCEALRSGVSAGASAITGRQL